VLKVCIITVTVECVVMWLVAVCTVNCIGKCIVCVSNIAENYNELME